MKRNIVILILLLVVLGLYGLDLPLYVGFEAGYCFWDQKWTPNPLAGGTDLVLDQSYITAGVFFDASYGDVSAVFKKSVGNISSMEKGASSIAFGSYDYSYSFLEFSAALKYPFSFGAFSAAPRIGIKYDLYLAGETKLDTVSFTAADYSDVFLSAGIEIQYKLSAYLILVVPVMIDYCLTAVPDSMKGMTNPVSLYTLSSGLGIGYRF
jgi:hypothetical protein